MVKLKKDLNRPFSKKWGKDYLRSLLRFHGVELCGNFKDESLQTYVTPQFAIVRKTANQIFLSLPTPKPNKVDYDSPNYTPPRAFQMREIYDYRGGCFDGNSIVQLQNGKKKVSNLLKGDILIDGGVVDCLVEIVQNQKQLVVEINGTLFSPYHPIKQNGNWVFPNEIASEKMAKVSSWFNVVTSGNKVIRVNGTEAITLGHGMTEGVLSHPYFGTDVVIQALQKRVGFNKGKVVVNESIKISRDDNELISKYF